MLRGIASTPDAGDGMLAGNRRRATLNNAHSFQPIVSLASTPRHLEVLEACIALHIPRAQAVTGFLPAETPQASRTCPRCPSCQKARMKKKTGAGKQMVPHAKIASLNLGQRASMMSWYGTCTGGVCGLDPCLEDHDRRQRPPQGQARQGKAAAVRGDEVQSVAVYAVAQQYLPPCSQAKSWTWLLVATMALTGAKLAVSWQFSPWTCALNDAEAIVAWRLVDKLRCLGRTKIIGNLAETQQGEARTSRDNLSRRRAKLLGIHSRWPPCRIAFERVVSFSFTHPHPSFATSRNFSPASLSFSERSMEPARAGKAPQSMDGWMASRALSRVSIHLSPAWRVDVDALCLIAKQSTPPPPTSSSSQVIVTPDTPPLCAIPGPQTPTPLPLSMLAH